MNYKYNDSEIVENLYPLWNMVTQYKLLYEYWKNNHSKKIKSEQEIRERLEYIKKNPNVKQLSEFETLLWILNDIEEVNNETY
ncbi:MAG: hypothetical protein IJN13_00405 [Bacilli bacterium]|nr:hypothetical protein [Bacilli bacterium]